MRAADVLGGDLDRHGCIRTGARRGALSHHDRSTIECHAPELRSRRQLDDEELEAPIVKRVNCFETRRAIAAGNPLQRIVVNLAKRGAESRTDHQ